MLEVRRLTKRFPGTVAVNQVTFTARRTEVTGYLGPNGSGKSTTMRIIAGLLPPTDGEVLFDGRPIHADLLSFKKRCGYVPEEAHLYSHLSGLEYLEMVGELRDLPRGQARDRIDGLLTLFSLHADRHVPISAYSKGMRQKVLIAAALLHNPDLLLLDEPFSGLDVGATLVLRRLIQELAARGKIVLLSSHELDTIEKISRRVVILHGGKVVADDTVDRLRDLMDAPTLERVFEHLAMPIDAAAVSREIADLVGA